MLSQAGAGDSPLLFEFILFKILAWLPILKAELWTARHPNMKIIPYKNKIKIKSKNQQQQKQQKQEKPGASLKLFAGFFFINVWFLLYRVIQFKILIYVSEIIL